RLPVHGAAGAFGRGRGIELGNNLVDGRGVAVHGECDIGIAERAVTLAVPGEIKIDDRNPLAPDVAPDVALRPVEERMDAQMCARRQVGVEVAPELGRLITEIPLAAVAAGAENPLLGPDTLLVSADAGDDAA